MNSNRLSCEGFLPEFSTSSDQMCMDPCAKLKKEQEAKSPTEQIEPEKCLSLTSTSTSSYMSCGIMQDICRSTKPSPQKPPNIEYEVAVAKSIMQEFSTISGDNLFDHLSDLIKRVIDERPPNVIDFFEEFSRNVREQKFHLPERFPPDAIYEETRLFKVAQKQLISMKLPYPVEGMALQFIAEDDIEEERSKDDLLKIELKPEAPILFHIFNDRVQHLQFFWNQCGFSISSDDIFQLACSMNRLQTHPSIRECRFWGMINGLKASYYVVEASLTNDECESRLIQMEREINENEFKQNMESQENIKQSSHIGLELTPGAIGWDNHPVDELIKMEPKAADVPKVVPKEVFDVPPEPIGRGVNRYSYFVVNSLSDEWIELPLITPKQVVLSRKIKKFFTGDLEAEIISYPCFNGKEKHYLRAMISRITAGTYIAPRDYYRKMTEKERKLYEGEEPEEGEENEEEEEGDESTVDEGEEEEEEGIPNNDIVLLKNEKYDPKIPIKTLNSIEMWLHVRSNILMQGRVVWFDEEKAQREREKERLRLEKLRLREGMEEEEEYNEEEGEEEGEGEQEEEEIEAHPEIGPAILSPCTYDVYPDIPVAWTPRFTSKFTNANERILVMQSNTWPGAYTFVYKDLCESIYLGWGHKYVARNMAWTHLPPIVEEYPHTNNDFIEAIDPSVEMEEAYQLSLLKKDLQLKYDNYEENEMGSTEAETDDDDEAGDKQ